jgi:hypothetical protein
MSQNVYFNCSDARIQTPAHRQKEIDLFGNSYFVSYTGPTKVIAKEEKSIVDFFLRPLDLLHPETVIIEGHSRCKIYEDDIDGKQLADMILSGEEIIRRYPDISVRYAWSELINHSGTKIVLSEIHFA